MAMNRIGRTAIGGIAAKTGTIGPSVTRTKGTKPSASPIIRIETVAMPTPSASRHRLAIVSDHAVITPVRGSGCVVSGTTASAMAAKVGSTLSLGLASARTAQKIAQTISSILIGTVPIGMREARRG
jgi:hypothetical protein